jgi:serine/threonine protein kinase
MIGYDGSVKLLDFGIAKAAERSVETQSGIIKGKFAYMAPEQCRGRDVDRRSDVFSLGIILYEATTQHRCFRADSDFDTMHRIVTGDVVRPSRLVHGYPQALEAIVMKALAVDPGQRYATAGLLLEALESFAVAARLSLSTVALGRFMRDMFGNVPEPWRVSGSFNRVAPPTEQTISSTSASGDAARVPPLPPPPSSPGAPALRPSPPMLSPSGLPAPLPGMPVPLPGMPVPLPGMPVPLPGMPVPLPGMPVPLPGMSVPLPGMPVPLPGMPVPLPGAERASSSSLSSPALQRASVSSLSSPALQRSSVPGLPPPQHEQAPMHLPPEIPLETAPTAVIADDLPPGWSPSGYPPSHPGTAPAAVAVAAPPPDFPPPGLPGALSAPLAPGMSTLGPHGFPDARSGSGPAHPGMHRPPHGTQPIARTRRGYDAAPGVARSEPMPRFEAHELEGNVSLQPSNRLLYMGIGGVLVGIIVLLAISILDNRNETPATATPPVAPRPSGAGDPSGPSPGGTAPVRPEAAAAAGSTEPAPGRRAMIHLHVVSTPAGAEVSLSGKPLGVTPLDAETERRTGSEVLIIHRARYQDIAAAVDLSRDYDQIVTLAPISEPARTPGGASPAGNAGSSGERDGRTVTRSPSTDHDPRPAHPSGRDGSSKRTSPGLPPKDLDCQPPDKLNPYEAACHGHVCKPCPVTP